MAATALRRRLSWQLATVEAISRETHRVRRIHLALPGWPGHRPGQHVDVRLTAEDGYTAQRSYSIASAPSHSGVDLIVERLDDGEVSPYLTEVLQPGDQLELRGPIGGYFVWPEHRTEPVQLIAGGSGVVPFLAMIAHHQSTHSTTPLSLLYSVRSEHELIGCPELAPRPGLDVTVTYTRTAPPGWVGPTGRLDRSKLERHLVGTERHPAIFVCGSTPFVETVATGLLALGYPSSSVKTERYGGTGDRT